MQLNKKLKHSLSKKVRTGLETAWKPLEKWPGNENEMGTKSFCNTSVSEVILIWSVSEKQDQSYCQDQEYYKSGVELNNKCEWSHLVKVLLKSFVKTQKWDWQTGLKVV